MVKMKDVKGSKILKFRLNGKEKEFIIDPDQKLIDLLRDEGYTGTKRGCMEGRCGACTVVVDGKAVYSCLLYAFQVYGRDVWTIEGVGSFDSPHPIQKALVDAGAVQCGYCTPGIVMSARAMLEQNPSPQEGEIVKMMDGNLCRCTGYEKIFKALLLVSGQKGNG